MRTGSRLSIGFAALVGVVLTGAAGAAAQAPPDPLLARLDALPRSTSGSTIRAEPVPGTDLVRVWIDANEDDTRLYSPAGGQMDADFQASALVRPGHPVGPVIVLFESHGPVEPGAGPRALVLRADGRPLRFAQREAPPSRSGSLLFLSTEAEVPFAELLRLAVSSRAEGRVWDVPFALLATQIELLRAWTHRVVEAAAGR